MNMIINHIVTEIFVKLPSKLADPVANVAATRIPVKTVINAIIF